MMGRAMSARAAPLVAIAAAAALVGVGAALWWIWGPAVALSVLTQFCL
jgi:hypothetical protein